MVVVNMNFVASIFMLVWLIGSCQCRPQAKKDIPKYRYWYKNDYYTMMQIPKIFKGSPCQLFKTHMVFGKNKIEWNFCGGSCGGKGSQCEFCWPTSDGKKSVEVDIVKDGVTVKKAIEVVTACECRKEKDCRKKT